MSESVGMTVGLTDAKTVYSECSEDITLGENISPAFCIVDESAEVLARFDNGRVSAARLGNRVFASLTYLPVGIAKRILRDAGAHVYTESGDPVFAASGCLLINCQGEGRHKITFPNGKTVEIKAKAYETLVFDVNIGRRLF